VVEWYLQVIEEDFIELIQMRQFHFHEVVPSIPVPYQRVAIDEHVVEAEVPEKLSEPAAGIGAFDAEVHEATIVAAPGCIGVGWLQHDGLSGFDFTIHLVRPQLFKNLN